MVDGSPIVGHHLPMRWNTGLTLSGLVLGLVVVAACGGSSHRGPTVGTTDPTPSIGLQTPLANADRTPGSGPGIPAAGTAEPGIEVTATRRSAITPIPTFTPRPAPPTPTTTATPTSTPTPGPTPVRDGRLTESFVEAMAGYSVDYPREWALAESPATTVIGDSQVIVVLTVDALREGDLAAHAGSILGERFQGFTETSRQSRTNPTRVSVVGQGMTGDSPVMVDAVFATRGAGVVAAIGVAPHDTLAPRLEILAATVRSLALFEPATNAVVVITPGQALSGRIQAAGGSSTFTLTAVAGVFYKIQTELGTLSDSVLRLLSSTGSSVLLENDDFEGHKDSRLYWAAPETGTYRIEVASGTAEGTGSFTLTLAFWPPDDRGNIPPLASVIEEGVRQFAAIEIDYDRDVFRFSAQNGVSYAARVDPLSSGFELRLLDGDGITILATGDGPISWNASHTATYYLEVRSTNPLRHGAYSIQVNATG